MPAASAKLISMFVSTTQSSDWGYAPQRRKAASFLMGRYDAQMHLLKGVWAGGEGYEANGLSIVDVNFFARRSLAPYNATMAAAIGAATDAWYVRANLSESEDRRVNMFGVLQRDILTVDTVTLAGAFPAPSAPVWVCTEKVNHTRRAYSPDRPYGVNAGVTMALSFALRGDRATASRIMRNMASWWDASTVCVMEPAAVAAGHCFTRALAYLLFGVRALRLESLLPDMALVEATLWRQQARPARGTGNWHRRHDTSPVPQVINCSAPCGNGLALAPTYSFGGEPMTRRGAHSSTEPANLALLAYDDRITTTWFPHGFPSLSVSWVGGGSRGNVGGPPR